MYAYTGAFINCDHIESIDKLLSAGIKDSKLMLEILLRKSALQ